MPQVQVMRRDGHVALGSPRRLLLLELVRMVSPCSVHDLAAHIGRSTTAVQRDIGVLQKAGLIERVAERRGGPRVEPLYAAIADDYATDWAPQTRESARELIKIGRSIAAATLEGFGRVVERTARGEQYERNEVRFRFDGAWLTREDVRVVNEHIGRVLELLHRGRQRRGGRPYLYTQFLVPLVEPMRPKAQGRSRQKGAPVSVRRERGGGGKRTD